MNASAVRTLAPAVSPASHIDLSAWRCWLQERIDPGWRTGEWDSARLLFTGDPDNPWTFLSRCRTRQCERIVEANTFCTPCSRAFARSGLSHADFVDTFRPDRSRVMGVRTADCLVVVGGVRCARESKARGLCPGHYSSWSQRRSRQPHCSFEDWIAGTEPYGAPAACLVRGCEEDVLALSGVLCDLHRRQWRKYIQEGRAENDIAAVRIWAETTALPYLSTEHFSLNATNPLARLEVIYALQERDHHRHKISPGLVRRLLRLAEGTESLAAGEAVWTRLIDGSRGTASLNALVRDTRRILGDALDRSRGIEPADKLVWDLAAVGVRSQRSAGDRRRHDGSLDFGQIVQPWLRELTMRWARETKPNSPALTKRFHACVTASQALSLRSGGGMDPSVLGFADMNAVIDGFRQMRNIRDGEVASAKRRQGAVSAFFEVLDYGRAVNLLEGMPAGFARHRSHRISVEEASEDDIGKSIPESVIRQLDDHLDALGAEVPYGDYPREDIRALFQTAYIVHRDTGRRPRETCGLGVDCLEYVDGEYTLLWDNRKGKRLRRRLPILASTARAILGWRERRAQLTIPARSVNALFPAACETIGECSHLPTNKFSEAIRLWVDSLPELLSDEPGPDGRALPFNSGSVFPYAFRFSYAQRHADAGVRVEVLKELMDHKSIDTTMVYFKISLNRKREAINTIRAQVVDRHGCPTPIGSSTAYQARSVAVPFGNCHEPTNVKAGGKACPIRFQCAGCGFYRPDPSYLPAVEDHIRSLKSDRETAQAMGADEFVIRNLSDQISAFAQVVKAIREHMDKLPAEERHTVEQASAVLRKVRATDGIPSPRERRLALPLIVGEHGHAG
ncbi:tyrosine-type recombinase/integrase [Nocardia carnea]|uniref:tyrosine-type recombinase/integrase n=1 Tax=Nocardia carnea TaxID=37328 RepID=UPI002456B80A|nr:tyrosine-type recombinase/integrase [Nocardia carnea]